MSAEAEMNAELGITELAHWRTMANDESLTTNPILPKPKIGSFTKFVPVGTPLVSIKF